MEDLPNVVRDLAAHPLEEEWFEFKENWFEAKELGAYIAGLSNAAAYVGRRRGYLVWGLRDEDHAVVGTSFTWKRNVNGEPLEHYLARQLSPSIAFAFQEIILDDKRLVVLSVPAASKVPTSFAGVRYQRIGSSKVNLAKYPDRELALFRVLSDGVPTAENRPAEFQDLSFTMLFTYYAGRGIALREDTFAQNLGLLLPDGRYNMLAQLLSDNSHTPVRVSVFKGKTKADPLHTVREFGNACLLIALDRVLDYIDLFDIPQADERNRRVERLEVPLFDSSAAREGIINAFVHNDWSGGNAPMFTVYSDRVEILSHGRLPAGQTMEGFFNGASVPVNQKLSDILLQLHISERSGRGVPKIVRAYGRGAYEFHDGYITLVIPFRFIDASENSDGSGRGSRTLPDAQANLTKTQFAILDLLRDNPNLTQPQIASAIGRGMTTVQTAFSILQKNGYIERVGSNKYGWWRVL